MSLCLISGPGELHIFQCVSHEAVKVVDDIYQWMRHYGLSAGSPTGPVDKITPSSNVNVKEAVTVFNQIAAQREKYVAQSNVRDKRLIESLSIEKELLLTAFTA